MRIRDPGWRKLGSGIRDGKKSDPGSGINIPDPQHCQHIKIQWEQCYGSGSRTVGLTGSAEDPGPIEDFKKQFNCVHVNKTDFSIF